jgi:type IV pilus assembly protein PilV
MAAVSVANCIGCQRGTSLIEVLVTVVIIAFGLLGLVGLQSRMQLSEMESYQRAQALVLLNDMANRIAVNRGMADQYEAAVGAEECATSPTTRPEADLMEWCNALRGAAELTSGGNSTGAMLGGRGCVQRIPPENEYMVTVAWQGLSPISAPPASVTCGVDEYDGGADSACTADRCRRVVTTIVRIATLD